MTLPDSSRGSGKEQIKPTELSDVLEAFMVTAESETGRWGSRKDQQEWSDRVVAERKRFGGRIEKECQEAVPYLRELCAEGFDPGFIVNRVVGRIAGKLDDIRIDRGGTDLGAIGFEAISGALAHVLAVEMQKEAEDEN